MNVGALSLDQTPPLSVPAPYLLTAPLFGVAAGLLLAFDGADLLQSRWMPGTLALTHLLTLGFLASAMFGALQQLLPVLLGVPLPRPRLTAWAIYLPFTLGAALLAAGVGTGNARLTGASLVLLGAAIFPFIAVAAWCLTRSRAAHQTVEAMGGALAALTVTAGLGLYLATAHTGAIPLDRGLTDIHAGWGLIGWVGLLVAGVAYQVVPMFQVTPEYPERVKRLLAPALFAGLVLWSLVAVTAPRWSWAAASLPAAALALFAVVTLDRQRRRRRRLPDVTVDFWRLAMASLVLCAAALLLAPAIGLAPSPLFVGALFVLGFAVSAVSGMLYKIVPFLVWLHLNNRLFLAGTTGKVPTMRQVIPEGRARGQFRLHAAALAGCALAALRPELAPPAGWLLAGSMGWLAFNLASALILYRRVAAGTCSGL